MVKALYTFLFHKQKAPREMDTFYSISTEHSEHCLFTGMFVKLNNNQTCCKTQISSNLRLPYLFENMHDLIPTS